MYSFVVLAILSACDGTSLIYPHEDIATKSKIPLSPVEISCSLNDVIMLTGPAVSCDEVIYRLHKPNGDITKSISSTKPKTFGTTNNFDIETRYHYWDQNTKTAHSKMIVKYINRNIKTVHPERMYKIIKIDDSDSESRDNLKIAEEQMDENGFIIGPLLEEDHGNWVLSVYCKDLDGQFIEMFQVITITIIAGVQMMKSKVALREGSTFNISFKYPIKDLQTCELTVPSGSTDRYFDRNRIELDTCGYIVSNITTEDKGLWLVRAVGRIVYEGSVLLDIIDVHTSEYDLLSNEEHKEATLPTFLLDREDVNSIRNNINV